jgi:hypothetical protein
MKPLANIPPRRRRWEGRERREGDWGRREWEEEAGVRRRGDGKHTFRMLPPE